MNPALTDSLCHLPDTNPPPFAKTLLIVDDEPEVAHSIRRSLRREDMNILIATSGAEALELIRNQEVGVVLSDQMMPEMDGISLLSAVRQHDPHIVRLLLTGYASMENAIEAINRSQIFEYLNKPWEQTDLEAALQRAFDYHQLTRENQRLQEVTQDQNRQLKQLNNSLEKKVVDRTRQLAAAVREGILMLSLAAEARDNCTGDHLQRIRSLTTSTCRQLGMPAGKSDIIGFFSMMHDVGKIHVPDHILNKTGKLSPEEWHIMQSHTVAGEKILGESRYYAEARHIARSHHERMDGKGYPDGLHGRQIPIAARIVAVADVFDALTHERPYKPAWTLAEAMEEIQSMAGQQLDAKVVKAFSEVMPLVISQSKGQ